MSTKLLLKQQVRFVVAFLLFLISGVSALAQSTANYTFASAATGSLALDLNSNAVDLTTGATTLIAAGVDDTDSALTNIGFDFWYLGTQYTQFSASDNGILTLGAVTGTTVYTLPNGTNPSLAPFANDLRTGTDGIVRSKLVGTAPNRCLVIEWSNTMIRYLGTAAAGTATFQARLYETTGAIEYVYGTMTTNAAAATNYNVGFSNNTTVNKVVTVNTTTHTASTSATVTNNTYTSSSTISSLNSASNGSRRFYKFTQTAPNAPTGLTFSAITTTSMNLNWTDASANELGFVIYSSTDNVNFSSIGQVAANSTGASVTGLVANTIYYYKVYAVREGALSAALSNSQSTLAQVILTAGSGTWTPPNCVTSVTVEVWGAGGGGGSNNNTGNNGGSGGGGGAYAKGTHTVAYGSTYYYTVGNIGTGGPANSTTAPTAGGSTWFNATANTNAAPATNTAGTLAVGGGAGVNNSTTAPSNGGLSTSSLGNVTRTSGTNGSAGTNTGGGNGGAGANGGAGGAGSTNADGASGTTPGGGGGGGNDAAANKGGDGAIGQIIITYTPTNTQTTAPVITSPICSIATSVSGTSTEANSTIIEVFKNGVSAGTTTVTSNAWTKTGLTVASGDVITATATSVSPCKATSALSASVTVSATPTTSTNGGNKTACVNTTTAALGGNTPTVGTGAWTCTAAPAGGSTGSITFTSATTGNTTAIVAAGATAGNYTLTWTISNSPCTASSSSLTLAVSGAPTTSTNGGNKTACVNTTTAALGGNTPTVGTGVWTCTAAPAGGSTASITFTSATTGNTTAIVAAGATAGNYTLTWTISNSPCSASTSTLTLAVSGTPTTSTNGGNKTACVNTTTAALGGNTPTVGTGAWTCTAAPAGGSTASITFTSASTGNTTAIVAAGATAGNYTLTWTISNSPCSASASSLTLAVSGTPTTSTNGGNKTACVNTTTAALGGNTPTVGTGAWTCTAAPAGGSTGSITFTSATTGNTTAIVAAGATAGNYTLTWTISNSPCSASTSTMTLAVSGTPTTSTNGGNKTACVNTTTAALGGNTPTVGTGAWTCTAAPAGGSTGSITFTSATTGNTTAIVAAGATAGNYTLTWTISNSPCSASTSSLTLAVSGTPTTATNSSTQTICAASTAILAGNTPTVGTGTWSVVSGPSTSAGQFSNVNSPTAVFTPAGGTGSYVVQWTISSSPCSTSSASATVTVGGGTSTWNGSAWDVTPSSTSAVVFAGNYTAAANLTFCSVTVTSGTVTIPSGYNITLNGAITVSGGSFVLENNANLVQNTNSANSGNIIVNRNSAAILRQDYTLWSSPVTNSGLYLQAFSPQTLATRFYTYSPSSNIYVAVSSPSTTPFSLGTGYLIRVANNHNAVTPTVWAGQFTGVPNNGPVSVTVGTGTYNAIGNPYPSTISADSFISANSLTEALYFWRKTNNLAQATSPTTSYATYTYAGGAGTGPSSLGGIVPNGTIQVGQGFIAKSTSTSLNFTNSMRTTNNSNQFLRTGERSRVWLDLYNASGSVTQLLVAYMPGATLGIDAAIDGHYINDSPTALTSIIDNEEFAVQGRPLPFEATDVVPLGFKSQAAGTFTIALNNLDGLFAANNQAVYLKDNLTNTIQDLTAASYTFATEAGTFNSRFEIVYENLLATQNPTFTENSVVVYPQEQQIVVNAGKATIAKVQVYDISGRLLVAKANVNATEVRFTAGMANQVLLVKVTSTSGAVVTKKIIN